MSDVCFHTLAVWSVFHNRWVALVTSDRQELIASLGAQFSSVVFCPAAIVPVAGGSDDDVVSALADLEAPSFDLVEANGALSDSVKVGQWHDAVHPIGDPNR